MGRGRDGKEDEKGDLPNKHLEDLLEKAVPSVANLMKGTYIGQSLSQGLSVRRIPQNTLLSLAVGLYSSPSLLNVFGKT